MIWFRDGVQVSVLHHEATQIGSTRWLNISPIPVNQGVQDKPFRAWNAFVAPFLFRSDRTVVLFEPNLHIKSLSSQQGLALEYFNLGKIIPP
jgi:hypothetical protein